MFVLGTPSGGVRGSSSDGERDLPVALVCDDEVLGPEVGVGIFLYFWLLVLLMACATGPVQTFSKFALSENLAVNSGSMAGSGCSWINGERDLARVGLDISASS